MKVHTEFNELMFTKKEGRMLEQLTVRDYDLGTSLPLFSNIGMSNLPLLKCYTMVCSGAGEEDE